MDKPADRAVDMIPPTDRLVSVSAEISAAIIAEGGLYLDRRLAVSWVDDLLGLLFPRAGGHAPSHDDTLLSLHATAIALEALLAGLVGPDRRIGLVDEFVSSLPGLRAAAMADAVAIEAWDPASASLDEVVLAYPGFYALAIHRIAHKLHLLEVPLLPRVVSELAHERTGVDIHPGAILGTPVMIDHGTGIVVGETARIGDRVRIYQGVTLGALSVSKAAAGTKRHPTVEDDVIIYANATILGGDTVVGAGSVIGGNAWVTRSVPPGSTVYERTEVRRGA
jgi:serine O-acetyltransferase